MAFDNDPYTQPDFQPGYHYSLPTFSHFQGLPLASYLRRLGAFGLDLAIFLLFWFTGTGFYHHFNNELLQRLGPDGDLRSIAGSQLLYLLIFAVFIFGGYGIYYVLTYGNGQTLGCRVAGLRLLGPARGTPGRQTALLRYICYVLTYGQLYFFGYLDYVEPYFIKLLNGDKYYGQLDKPPVIVGILLTGLVWAVPHLTMLFNSKKQSLYDIAFKVLVIRAR